MGRITLPIFLVCLAAGSQWASAAPVVLGFSTQTVTFTGIGALPSGQGQSRVAWGACVAEGSNTKCTVSGPYTGLGGGTYSFVLTYPGSGPSPLTAISNVPGGDRIFFNLTGGSFLTSLIPTNGVSVTFYDPTFFFDFYIPTCTGVSSCAVGQVGLTPNATITGTISGTFNPTPIIRDSQGVISAGDFGAFSAIAPAGWIEIYGTNLATTLGRVWGAADFNGDLAPTSLGGTTVTIGGKSAFIDFVSPHQVNAQVPSGLPSTPQPVVVTTAGGDSDPTMVTVNSVQPGLLAPPAFKAKAGQYAAALFPDAITFVLPPGTIPGVRAARAKPGDVITFYGVGFGPVTPDIPAGRIVRQNNPTQATFQASFAGTPANIKYAGLVQGFLGLYQFNVEVPNVAASDTIPFTFTLGETKGQQTLLIPVQ